MFTILYEESEALIRLQVRICFIECGLKYLFKDLLKLPTETNNKVRIVVQQLDIKNKENNM